MRGRRSGWAARCAILAAGGISWAAWSGPALDWRQPWQEPQDPKAASERSDEYAWALFVAINWPAHTESGAPDVAAALGANQPVVWETWISASSVYRPDGHDPGEWRPSDAQAHANDRHFEDMSARDLPNMRHIVNGVMVPVTDPVEGARRLTEIRMNRPAFDFVRSRELYNIDGQLRVFDSGKPVRFPYGAREVKAKWRPIGEAERGRYHTMSVRFADGSSKLYGLTALHIISKDLPHWFWATFEQVENPTLPDNEGWQLPSRDAFACPRGSDLDCNLAPRGIGLDGTVWQYYRLRGTLTRFTDAQGAPQRLANSELEQGMQSTASCITCHSRATIADDEGKPGRLGIFDVKDSKPDEPTARSGYVGEPGWLDAGYVWDGRRYQSLDFVWSLSKAQPRAP
jgi:hypothetical protein